MRWTKSLFKDGDIREVTRFLWWPRYVACQDKEDRWIYEWRWLERATIKQRYKGYLGDGTWRNIKWKDD